MYNLYNTLIFILYFKQLNLKEMGNTIKIVNGYDDQKFVWHVITNKSKEIFNSGLFEVYILHDDDSESLCTTIDDINEALERGEELGIEVGFIPDIVK